MTVSRLDIWDYVVLCFVVLATCIPGLVHVYRSKNTKNDQEFSGIGRRGSSIIAVAMSIAATNINVTLYVGLPSDVYKQGIVFFWFIVGLLLAIPVGSHLYLPVFFNNKTASIFEFIEQRFNRQARKILSAIYVLRALCTASLGTYAAAIALSHASGLNIWICAVSTNIVCIFYSAMGGFKAVIFTDVLQVCVIVLVIFCVIIKGYLDTEGFSEIWASITRGKRDQFFIVEPSAESGMTMWPIFIGSFFLYLSVFTKQSHIQRCLNCQNLQLARRASFFGLFLVAVAILLLFLYGLLMFAEFIDCDPLLARKVKASDQVSVFFAERVLSFAKGLTGLYFAGLVCTSISSLSSTINSSVSLIMEDFVKPILANRCTELQYVRISKIIGAVYGSAAVLLIFFVENFQGIITVSFVILGVFTGPVVGLFTLGMLSPWTGTIPACVGTFASIILIGWVSIGRLITMPKSAAAPLSVAGCNFTGMFSNSSSMSDAVFNRANFTSNIEINRHIFSLYTFSPFWYICWSTLFTIIVGLLATILIGSENPENVDSSLIFPLVSRLLRKLPAKLRQSLGFKTVESRFFKMQPENDFNTTGADNLDKEFISLSNTTK